MEEWSESNLYDISELLTLSTNANETRKKSRRQKILVFFFCTKWKFDLLGAVISKVCLLTPVSKDLLGFKICCLPSTSFIHVDVQYKIKITANYLVFVRKIFNLLTKIWEKYWIIIIWGIYICNCQSYSFYFNICNYISTFCVYNCAVYYFIKLPRE